jgi:hypothetical protein
VQCDGSQGDSCGEYEQQLPITTSRPLIIFTSLVLLSSKVGISQFEGYSITMDVVFWMHTWWSMTSWIPPTVGTGTLSSADRGLMIGILWWIHLTWTGGCCGATEIHLGVYYFSFVIVCTFSSPVEFSDEYYKNQCLHNWLVWLNDNYTQ